jgi:hypothetical protein
MYRNPRKRPAAWWIAALALVALLVTDYSDQLRRVMAEKGLPLP